MIAGRKAALLEVAAVSHELDQPPVDAEGVHQRAAFGGGAIGGDAMPLPLQAPQQRQQLFFQARDPFAKVAIVIEAQQALGFFLRQQLADRCRCRPARMRNEQP